MASSFIAARTCGSRSPAPVLEGAEGARRGRGQVRGRQGAAAPGQRDETEQRTGQSKYPWIEFEDGSVYREESKDMAERIRDGKLTEAPRRSVIVPDEIDGYAAAHTTPPPELLAGAREGDPGDARARRRC